MYQSFQTLVSGFEYIAGRFGNRLAMTWRDDTWTYRMLDMESDRVAAGLLALGAGRGTKIGLWANERPNAMIVYLGILKCGAATVMLNTSWTAEEIRDRIMDTDVEILFYDEGYRDLDFPEIVRSLKLPQLKKCIYIGETAADAEYTLEMLIDAGRHLPQNQLEDVKVSIVPEDEDIILFTSGSQSRPKPVVTTHGARLRCAYAQAEMIRGTHEDIYLLAIPMFHCFSLTGNLLAAWMTGAAIVLPESRRTDHLLRAIERWRCSVFTAVPTLFSAVLANPHLADYDISSLRTGLIGGSIYPEKLFIRICDSLDMQLLPSLGQTEATSCITCGGYEDPLHVRASTAGHFVPGVEGKIIDSKNGATLPAGRSGEICFRGFNVMKGYYKQEDLTKSVLDADGFIHTGDLGFLDEAGNLHMTGRLKELIIRGGENIAPGEIEHVLAGDDRVGQVKVVGIPDDHYGEEVCACLILKEGAEMTPEAVRSIVRASLAAYKVPRYVLFTDVFPEKGSGKIDTAAVKCWAMRQCLGQ